jgi:hypothetical protein
MAFLFSLLIIWWLKKLCNRNERECSMIGRELPEQYWIFSVHGLHTMVCLFMTVIAARLAVRPESPRLEIGYSALLFLAVSTGVLREVSRKCFTASLAN